ncbi:phosphoribosylanthranilate isomerase [Treponema primitia]|uniref:phosphoribosylanthranilate isomerase n=1 Tax=Treponema primitia TaxID=88058 RepID=UPI0003113743|nr:phosphoribosylanthranilate isomerase [Treponema primitia]
MKIKICGLFREADIDFANEARPDYIGFVFAKSKRQVSLEQASQLRARLRDDIVPVGVFVNAPVEEIAALYQAGVIDIVQLHGGEDREYIAALRGELRCKSRKQTAGVRAGFGPIPVIKALRIDGAAAFTQSAGNPATDGRVPRLATDGGSRQDAAVNPGAGSADYLLLDQGSGGTGTAFDWTVLGDGAFRESLGAPFFLAGGINEYNIEEAVRYGPFGIDVSSGAETDGVKDRDKMIRLVKIVRNHI